MTELETVDIEAEVVTIPEVGIDEGNLIQEDIAKETVTPTLTKKFKGSETYMSHNGVMMERDVYYMIPTTAVDLPYPEEHSFGLTYENNKPKGRLFSGQNRHARRAAEKQKSKKIRVKLK